MTNQILSDLLEVSMSQIEFRKAMDYFGITMEDYHSMYDEITGNG